MRYLTAFIGIACLASASAAYAGPPKPPRTPAAVAGAPEVESTLPLTPSDAHGKRNVSGRRTMAPDGEVRISNVAGSIRVTAWDRSEVQVTGTVGEDVERLEFGGTDAYTVVRVILPRGNHCCNDGEADLTINVPRVARVDVDTVSADVNVADAAGAVRVNTVSGEIGLKTRSRDLDASSVSGDLDLVGNGAQGRVKARSVSGDIDITGADGEFDTESVSGDVTLQRSRAARLSMKSTSGDVSYTGGVVGTGSYEFQTVSGDVKVTFEGSRDAAYDISTFSGDIDNSFGPRPRRTSEYAPGYELRFTEGKGAARIRINTLSGDVTLDKR